MKSKQQHIVPKCDGCFLVDFRDGTCTVFREPEFQWQDNKQCWGQCEDPEELIKRFREMAAYNRRQGNNHTAVKLETEIQFWKEYTQSA